MNPFEQLPPPYTAAELIADHTRVLEGHRVELNELHLAYQHWMRTNTVVAIQLMEDSCLTDHFSNRLLLAEGSKTNLECLQILWRSGINCTTLPDELQQLLFQTCGTQGINDSGHVEVAAAAATASAASVPEIGEIPNFD